MCGENYTALQIPPHLFIRMIWFPESLPFDKEYFNMGIVIFYQKPKVEKNCSSENSCGCKQIQNQWKKLLQTQYKLDSYTYMLVT